MGRKNGWTDKTSIFRPIIFNFIRHSMTAEIKKKQQTNKQLYKYGQFKSFSSRLAKPETAPQIEL